jgi:hypothetical protein
MDSKDRTITRLIDRHFSMTTKVTVIKTDVEILGMRGDIKGVGTVSSRDGS